MKFTTLSAVVITSFKVVGRDFDAKACR